MEGTERIDEGLSTTGGYAMIPGWVAERLSHQPSSAWAVYFEIARRASKKRYAWPSQERISADTGIPLRTVSRAITTLREIGAIVVQPRTSPGKGRVGVSYLVPFDNPHYATNGVSESQPVTNGVSAPVTNGVSAIYKDEEEKVELEKSLPIIPLTQSSLPELPLAESVRDLPFPDREQSASDTAPIENKLPDRTQPISGAKALRAAEAEHAAAGVMEHFRQVTGRPFRLSKAAVRNTARVLASGGTTEAMKLVIDHRNELWGKDEKMRQYLRPETLFIEAHFDTYLIDAQEWDALGRPAKQEKGVKQLPSAQSRFDQLGEILGA